MKGRFQRTSLTENAMSSQLFSLRCRASADQVACAIRMAGFLKQQGFGPQDLDDLVYTVAESICMRQREKLSDDACLTTVVESVDETDPSARARQEFSAADEINGRCMIDQLVVIGAWLGNVDKVRETLREALRIEVPAMTTAC